MSETAVKPKKVKKPVVIVESVATVEPTALAIQEKQSPDSMIFMALEKGLDITIIERLMLMRNSEIARIAKSEYLQAMAKFQAIIPDLQKNRNVDYTSKSTSAQVKYNYQDLGSIIHAIKGSMAECGLTHKWEQTEKDGIVTVVCIVSHVGGHEERGAPLSGQLDTSGNKAGLHAKASTITYLQRYTLKGILGLTSTETDDDGLKGVKKEQEATHNDKPKLDGSQLNQVIERVLSGKETIESIREKWALTQGQESAIVKAQGSK